MCCGGRIELSAKRRTEGRLRVPAAVEEHEHRLDVVLLADGQELIDPREEPLDRDTTTPSGAVQLAE